MMTTMSDRISGLTRFPLRRITALAFAMGIALIATPVHYAYAEEDEEEAEAQAEAAEAAQKAEARRAAKAAAPPAALPGAQSSEMDGKHSDMDLEPTAALYEAVTIGSLSAAKEAVNRGADLNGHNVLGQTALDMAIDLNRNDIIFFLLSMRGVEDAGYASRMSSSHGDVTVSKGSGHMSVGGTVSTRSVSVKSPRHPVANGGVAKPSVGFLGFDGS